MFFHKKFTCCRLSRSSVVICLGALLVIIIFASPMFFFLEVSDGEGWYNSRSTYNKMSSVIDKASKYYEQHQVFPKPSDLNLSEEKLDGWGREFMFERAAGKGRYFFKVQSSGSDGKVGTEDDMVKWFPIEPEFADPNSPFGRIAEE